MRLPGVSHALVVEDDPDIRRHITRTLEELAVQVRHASGVQAALGQLVPPLDLVIADIRLPDGTGHSVLRAAMSVAPVPVLIAISGVATPAEAFDLGRLGTVAFLSKPFGLAQLERTLRDACAIRPRAPLEARSLPPGAEAGLLELSRRHGLTPRQIEVVRLVASGARRSELPRALGISPTTCKALVRRVLERCGIKRLSELLPVVLSHSTHPPPE